MAKSKLFSIKFDAGVIALLLVIFGLPITYMAATNKNGLTTNQNHAAALNAINTWITLPPVGYHYETDIQACPNKSFIIVPGQIAPCPLQLVADTTAPLTTQTANGNAANIYGNNPTPTLNPTGQPNCSNWHWVEIAYSRNSNGYGNIYTHLFVQQASDGSSCRKYKSHTDFYQQQQINYYGTVNTWISGGGIQLNTSVNTHPTGSTGAWEAHIDSPIANETASYYMNGVGIYTIFPYRQAPRDVLSVDAGPAK